MIVLEVLHLVLIMQTLTFKQQTQIKKQLIEDALFQGFDVCAITDSSNTQAGLHLIDAINKNYHGDMDWMKETLERRLSPTNLWPDTQSVIMLAMNYGPDTNPIDNLKHKSIGNISVYARHRDYHDVIKGKLKHIASRLAARTGAGVKVFVDTAPIMEKPLAQAAGIGWQGKHTNLVSREYGSWLFLGSIFTDMVLPYDNPTQDHCGTCNDCLQACPTNAFPAPYQLDARRCISYLTIEHKEQIALEFRQAIGNRIYGCDDCLSACPWNKFAKQTHEMKLQARDDLKSPPLSVLLSFDDTEFRRFFSGSPVKRIGRDRFMRNCLIAAGNSNDTTLIPIIENHLMDPNPLIAGMSVWAIRQLIDQKAFKTLKNKYANIHLDKLIVAEWECEQ